MVGTTNSHGASADTVTVEATTEATTAAVTAAVQARGRLLGRPVLWVVDECAALYAATVRDAARADGPVTAADDVCSWLGHDWGWGSEPCGQAHTFRVCGRCDAMESDCADAFDGGRDGGCAGSGVAA